MNALKDYTPRFNPPSNDPQVLYRQLHKQYHRESLQRGSNLGIYIILVDILSSIVQRYPAARILDI